MASWEWHFANVMLLLDTREGSQDHGGETGGKATGCSKGPWGWGTKPAGTEGSQGGSGNLGPWGIHTGSCGTRTGTHGQVPLTHQVYAKVNTSQQEAQEETECHDPCGGACGSPTHSTGTHQSQSQQHNSTAAKPREAGGLLVTQGAPGRMRSNCRGLTVHRKAGGMRMRLWEPCVGFRDGDPGLVVSGSGH